MTHDDRRLRLRKTVAGRVTPVLIALAMLGALLAGTATDAQAQADPLIVVSIGDSYIAGTGAGDYYPDQGPFESDIGGPRVPAVGRNCYQSYSSFPWQFVQQLNDGGTPAEIWHAACNGAETHDLRAQWETIPADKRYDADIILISAGGNDAGFASIVADCILGFASLATCLADLTATETELPLIVDRIEAEMEFLATQALGAHIAVVGYPYLLSPATCFFAQGVAEIDALQIEHEAQLTAMVAGLNSAGPDRFHFALTSPYFLNQGPCATSSLFHYITLSDHTFHPTLAGHTEYANAVFAQGYQGLAPPAVPTCDGVDVTIDLNVNGGIGDGTDAADVILGTPGPDDINSGSGDDVVCGGGGDDFIRGGPGNDVLRGGPGNDEIRAAGGDDNIDGGVGDDEIDGQGGLDTIQGGLGDDIIEGRGAPDTIQGGPGADTISGHNGADEITGGGGNDDITGQTGPDMLTGGAGDDELGGGSGNDVLFGGDGNDRCSGNTGQDQGESATCETLSSIETLF